MSLSLFKIRNPERDKINDEKRYRTLAASLGRLQADLEVMATEIDAERLGLEQRYLKATDMAAFSMESFENGEGSDLSRKADEFHLVMERCRARLDLLGRQRAVVDRCLVDLQREFQAGA